MSDGDVLKVTLDRSYIGATPHQRKVLHALGLKRIRQTVTRPDNPSTWGMIRIVEHMVSVSTAAEANND